MNCCTEHDITMHGHACSMYCFDRAQVLPIVEILQLRVVHRPHFVSLDCRYSAPPANTTEPWGLHAAGTALSMHTLLPTVRLVQGY